MTSQELALRQAVDGAIAQFRDPAYEAQVALAVPEGVSPRKLLRVASTAVLDNKDLAKPELRPSLLQATLKCGADGLLPDGREAAFVIFGGREPKVQYMPMIVGFRKIAAEYGWMIFTACVFANDDFDPDLEAGRANHKPARLGTDRGDLIGAYAVAEHKDGRRMIEIMDVEEIEKVRSVSRAKDRGPWVDWYEQMAQIRPARRLFKKLPLDPKDAERVARVVAAADLNGSETVEALYGTAPDHDGGDSSHAAAGLGAGEPQTPAPGDSWEPVPDEADDGLGAPLNEPSDEELDGEAEVVQGTIDEEARFDRGKAQGQTIMEVLQSGKRGENYIRWAIREWKAEPMRSALDAFAEAHPDLVSE